MSFAKLPSVIVAALKAINEHDTPALLDTFAQEALLTDQGIEVRGEAIARWSERALVGSRANIHPINSARSRGAIIVTAILSGNPAEFGIATPAQVAWRFKLDTEKILELQITEEKVPSLSGPIAAYVWATNTFDLDALVATFAEDAVVNDQLCEYFGKPAIKAWAAQDIVGCKFTMYVLKVFRHDDRVIIRANADGIYEKRGLPEPLTLSFYFSEKDGKIVQLIILRNQASD
jgi:ketosteroid isomerase-like protein